MLLHHSRSSSVCVLDSAGASVCDSMSVLMVCVSSAISSAETCREPEKVRTVQHRNGDNSLRR